jgi:hypothetical protein
MSPASPDRSSIIIIVTIMILFLSATILLAPILVAEPFRPATFNYSIGYICYLEVLVGLYFGCLFSPSIRSLTAIALLPGWGIVIFFYLVAGLSTIYFSGRMPRLFTALLTLETLVFLVIIHALYLLGRARLVEEQGQRFDQKQSLDFKLRIQEIKQQFSGIQELFPSDLSKRCVASFQRLEERSRQITPFGRSCPGEIDQIIETQVIELAIHVRDLADIKDEAKIEALVATDKRIRQLLQSLERREAAMVR